MADLDPQDMNVVINDGEDITLKANVIADEESINRLAVNGLITSMNNVPSEHFRFIISNMKTSGGSQAMNVDGSVTPVNFDYAPAATDIFYAQVLSFVISDNGINDLSKFAALVAALTNGVQIELYIGGVTYVVGTIKTNSELITTFNTGIGVSNSLFSSTIAGNITFDSPVRLVGDDGDYIRIVIQDDIEAVSTFEARIQGFEVL